MLKCSLQRHDLANLSLDSQHGQQQSQIYFSPALTEYNLLTMVRKSEPFSRMGGGGEGEDST